MLLKLWEKDTKSLVWVSLENTPYEIRRWYDGDDGDGLGDEEWSIGVLLTVYRPNEGPNEYVLFSANSSDGAFELSKIATAIDDALKKLLKEIGREYPGEVDFADFVLELYSQLENEEANE